MKLEGISQKVFIDRYSQKDTDGKPTEKTPDEMWKRVSNFVGTNEQERKDFFSIMKDFKYVAGGRILASAGTGYSTSFYNCYVIPSPKDSRGGIIATLGEMVEIMANGGGVGINISSLRPRGDRVTKVNGFSSGACNWAEMFSLVTKDVIQQGGSRRGALMLMMNDWHPDIEEFITVKKDLKKINGANLSVAISDKFMDAVKNDKDWDLVFPDKDDKDYDDVWNGDIDYWKSLGKKIIVKKTVKAREIWNLLSQSAWASAEPGVVFMERYNKMHNNYYWNSINCVNPCGEEGLPPYGVCNLGSINLSTFVKNGKFDFENLESTVKHAVRFQDNIIDKDKYVLQGIEEVQKNGERRIGLGTMGLADTLIKLKIVYGSNESLEFIDKVYGLICNVAYCTSSDLAKEKGSFPKFDKEKYLESGFVKTLPDFVREKINQNGIRNSLLLMQAPTGSTSLMCGVSSGIEPIFEFEFKRKDRLGEHIIRHPLYDQWYKENGENAETKRPDYFVTSNDLTPEDHIKVQARIQKYVDASISKTVNAPNSHTVEDVKNVFDLAYDMGLKGIAYFRDGSRDGVYEKTEVKKEDKKDNAIEIKKPKIIVRPKKVIGCTYEINTPVGTAYITINTDQDNNPIEIFVNIGKAGSDVYAMAEGIGRVASLFLRTNSRFDQKEKVCKLIEQLQGIGGSRGVGFGKERIKSLPDAIARALAMHFLENEKQERIQEKVIDMNIDSTNKDNKTYDICPSCGEALLVHEEGCKKCYGCGYSEC